MTGANLDNFETALLTELRTHVAEQAAHTPTRRPLRHRITAFAATAAAASAIVAGSIALRPDAAFAVVRQPDGDVVITIERIPDSAALERALRDKGVDAEVTYDSKARVVSDLDDGSGPTCDWAPGSVVVDHAESGATTVTLKAAWLAAHDSTLHITTAGGRHEGDWIGAAFQWGGAGC